MSSFWDNLHPLIRRSKQSGDDPNYAVLNAIADTLSQAETDAIESKAQSYLKTATSTYLDAWGEWFGIIRNTSETDTNYRARIIQAILVERGTIKGIQDAVNASFPNSGITVYETWKNIFYLNDSHLNGEDYIQGNYYRFAVIKVTVRGSVTTALKRLVETSAPVGIRVVYEVVS